MKWITKKCTILLVVMTLLFFGLSTGDNFVKTLKHNGIDLFSPYPTLILQFAIYCVVGIIFGFEKFLSERKQSGYWRINKHRLFIIGIPSFLMGIYYILYFTIPFIPSIISRVFIDHSLFVNFMQMLFGYIIITSFYKSDEILLTKK